MIIKDLLKEMGIENYIVEIMYLGNNRTSSLGAALLFFLDQRL